MPRLCADLTAGEDERVGWRDGVFELDALGGDVECEDEVVDAGAEFRGRGVGEAAAGGSRGGGLW